MQQYKKTVAVSNVLAGPIPIYEYYHANNYFFFNMTCQVQDYEHKKLHKLLAFITKLL